MKLPIRSLVIAFSFALLGLVPSQALIVTFDYRYDTTGFFTPEAKTTLAAVGDVYGSLITTQLSAITPGGGNTWSMDMRNPSTGTATSVSGYSLAADTIVLFMGSASQGPTKLGLAGPGGYTSNGFSGWHDTVANRGSDAARAGDAFVTWGGTVTINTGQTWNFSLDNPEPLKFDLYSVVLHEVGHVLGIGIVEQWTGQVSGTVFTGPNATAANGGVNPALNADKAHWSPALTSPNLYTGDSQTPMYNPSMGKGVRMGLTELDVAGLQDLGWQTVPEPSTCVLFGMAVFVLGLRRRRGMGECAKEILYSPTAMSGATNNMDEPSDDLHKQLKVKAIEEDKTLHSLIIDTLSARVQEEPSAYGVRKTDGETA